MAAVESLPGRRVVPVTRAEKIRCFIELEALAIVSRGGVRSGLAEMLKHVNVNGDESPAAQLRSELWPREEDVNPGTIEYEVAEVESMLLASRLLDYLAENGAELARECRDWALMRMQESPALSLVKGGER